ncbi:hypothetical protein Tco_1045985 [Tanacetum coccineum]
MFEFSHERFHNPESIVLAAFIRVIFFLSATPFCSVPLSLSSFITIAKGGSSSIFTLFSLPAGAELTFEAEELLLPLAGAEDGSFIMTPFKVSALNVDFDLKIDLIVYAKNICSAPSNIFSGGRGVLQTEDSSVES